MSSSSNTPAVQRLNPSLRWWCALTKWHGSQPKNIRLKTPNTQQYNCWWGEKWLNTWGNVHLKCIMFHTHSRVISHYMHQCTIFLCSLVYCRTLQCWQKFRTVTWFTCSLDIHSNQKLRYRHQHFCLSIWDNCKCLLSKILSDLCFPDICYSNHFRTVVTTCYYSAQKLLSSHWLAKNSNIKIYWTVMLPAVLHTCETWSLTLSEGHQVSMFQNRLL